MARGEGTGSLWGIASYYARYLSLLTLFAPSVRGESFFNEGYGVARHDLMRTRVNPLQCARNGNRSSNASYASVPETREQFLATYYLDGLRKR